LGVQIPDGGGPTPEAVTTANASGGNYYFIESGDQMAYQFQQELFGMMRVTALQPTLTIDMADGVNVREVYGYDVSRSGNRVSARIGDLIGGRKITVTAALDVAATRADRMALATVALNYTDATDGRSVSLSQGVVAELSPDETQQVASADLEVTAQVQRVQNAEAVTEAMEAFAAGEDERATRIVERAREETREFNSVAGAAADMGMEDDLDSLMMEMEEAAPSAAGRSSVSKSRKAAARDDARGQ